MPKSRKQSTRDSTTSRESGSRESGSTRSSKSSSRSSRSQGSRTSSHKSQKSNDSYGSESTTPTSLYASPRPSDVKTTGSGSYKAPSACEAYEQDHSPGTNYHARDSCLTYASTTASEEMALADESDPSLNWDCQDIPPLPVYRREIVDTNVRPSTPQDFAKLFPSLNRLSIRHDEFTSDGNMNLRVDTAVPGRKKHSMQLFHLRMYDLARREFSLRRYCRDSGREVCNSKRQYTEPPPEGRPTLQRSMTSAIKTLGGRPSFGRTNSGTSMFSSKRAGSSHSSSSSSDDDEFAKAFGRGMDKRAQPQPTDAIKLEFSNYARVDVRRRGGRSSKRYEFEWWGHKYQWKRVPEKHLNVVNFHLLRDGKEKPIAHIVPEPRSPNQVLADEQAGGWVPPCHMYITDKSVVSAMTDVADVIMATGLIALVDDCIKERWQTPKAPRIPVPLTSKTVGGAKAFMQQLFSRQSSTERQPSSRLRRGNTFPVY